MQPKRLDAGESASPSFAAIFMGKKSMINREH
jgi:hypothetical protein